MRSAALVPGTCGELVQGVRGNNHFLVSFPVNRYSKVTVELGNNSRMMLCPPWCVKVKSAVENTLSYLGVRNLGASVKVETSLPIGKGWASSSADILAGIWCTAACLGYHLTNSELAKLALAIEPTDSIFLPGLAIFDHRSGHTMEVLGEALPLRVLALEFNSSLDTIVFNNRSDLLQLNKLKETEALAALDLIKQGIVDRNLQKVAQGATMSAFAHQHVLHKPMLEQVYQLSLEHEAEGVCVAHSGTTIGILFPENYSYPKALVDLLWNKVANIHQTHWLQGTGGGIQPIEDNYSLGRIGVEAY